uniref:Uncharacterized protein n=1 Tax=Prymnesium polylepis TaxID=72548 RepID=A0A7S4MZB3_9EUKA|mmetsp:Transcript_40703/g.101224  ORF Transcript_40703/g.101224 Transcript_40703/m.101224 type:complete len:104 (+) Transcript_40703:22-333(+)
MAVLVDTPNDSDFARDRRGQVRAVSVQTRRDPGDESGVPVAAPDTPRAQKELSSHPRSTHASKHAIAPLIRLTQLCAKYCPSGSRSTSLPGLQRAAHDAAHVA